MTRYSDIGCYGAKKVKTPHIDRLAEEGFTSKAFLTGASICSPSRAAFLTGAYPQRSGLYMGINPNRRAHWFLGLHPDEITLAEHCKAHGYDTFMVGKWHLGTEPEFLPRNRALIITMECLVTSLIHQSFWIMKKSSIRSHPAKVNYTVYRTD